jgi:RNase P subunit RPR2
MAAAHLVELRLGYLRDATHLLAVSSPSAASFFGSAKDRLIDDAELDVSSKDRDSLRRETCGACGNLMIPGWSCKVRNRSHVQIERKDHEKNSKEHKCTRTSTVYSCLRCNRETSQPLKPKPLRRLRGTHSSLNGTVKSDRANSRRGHKHPIEGDDTRSPKSINANSKLRQKARKGGLQAMLEKTKVQNSSQGGLDLMDFAM